MNTFSVTVSDVVFVNVAACGRNLVSFTLKGNSSTDELMSALRGMLAGYKGLLSVNLRNSTQGTATKVVLRLNRQSVGGLRAQMQGYAA